MIANKLSNWNPMRIGNRLLTFLNLHHGLREAYHGSQSKKSKKTLATIQCVKGNINLFIDDLKIRTKVYSQNQYVELKQL